MRYSFIICFLLLSLVFFSCGSGGGGGQSERLASGPGTSNLASTDIKDMQSVKDILFAAYAGIAYGTADDKSDNDMFYDIMFYNLNSMAGDLSIKAIDPPKILRLSYIMSMFSASSTNDTTLPYSEKGINEELLLKGNLQFTPFKIMITSTASLDYHDDGSFYFDNWSWAGETGVTELSMITIGDLTEYQDIETNTQGTIANLRSVSINTHNLLEAVFNKYKVQYNNWSINYSANVNETDTATMNMYILPLTGDHSSPEENPDYPDNREYSVSGSFVINGNEYAFGEGFTYKQLVEQTGLDENDKPITNVNVSIEGSLKIPDKEGFVEISSSDINPIVRDSNGIFKSGILYIGGHKDFAEVEFNEGAAIIYYGSENETINSWQTMLRPVL